MKIERYAKRKKRERRLFDPCFVLFMLVILIVTTIAISSSIVGSGTQDIRDKVLEEHKQHIKDLEELDNSIETRKIGVELNQARRYYEIDQ